MTTRMLMDKEDRLEITVGDLIALAMKLAGDEQEASKVIAFALTHLVYNGREFTNVALAEIENSQRRTLMHEARVS